MTIVTCRSHRLSRTVGRNRASPPPATTMARTSLETCCLLALCFWSRGGFAVCGYIVRRDATRHRRLIKCLLAHHGSASAPRDPGQRGSPTCWYSIRTSAWPSPVARNCMLSTRRTATSTPLINQSRRILRAFCHGMFESETGPWPATGWGDVEFVPAAPGTHLQDLISLDRLREPLSISRRARDSRLRARRQLPKDRACAVD